MIHLKHLIEAFAVGVLDADPFFREYEPPPRYAEAVRLFCRMALREFRSECGVIEVSLADLHAFVRQACGSVREQPKATGPDHRDLLAIMHEWNTPRDGNASRLVAVSRFDRVQRARDFIDIDALVTCTINRLDREIHDEQAAAC